MAISAKSIVLLGAAALLPALSSGQQSGIRIHSVAHGTTPPLISNAPIQPRSQAGTTPRVIIRPRKPGGGGGKPGGGGGSASWSDPIVQISYAISQLVPGTSFQGQGFTGAIPPDPNLSVGKDPNGNVQIVQTVNTSYAVYHTDGTLLASGDMGALFAAIPNSNCYVNADGGDVVVLFDKFDSRWVMSQLAYSSDFTQNDVCLALSDTADATGSWEVYDVSFGGSTPDYPKLGIWSDGVYFSANMFHLKVNPFTGSISSTFLGAEACSFSRWTAGAAVPASVTFSCSTPNMAVYNILPADIDGMTLPPSGSDYYLQFATNLSSTSGNELILYQFNPNTRTLTTVGTPLQVATFHEACGGITCIPQAGTTQQLDSLGDRLMYRLSYRNYGSGNAALVVNHSVQLSSASAQTGIRWYRLCTVSGGSFTVCNESTFSPDNSTYRWMGSIAQDSAGNLGLGYSVSGSAAYPDPGIAVTGALAGTGAMQPEQLVFAGPNFQDTYNRWGDYSSMSLAPDDCTFWYTTEYSTTTNFFGIYNFFWGTVIDSFQLPGCTPK